MSVCFTASGDRKALYMIYSRTRMLCIRVLEQKGHNRQTIKQRDGQRSHPIVLYNGTLKIKENLPARHYRDIKEKSPTQVIDETCWYCNLFT